MRDIGHAQLSTREAEVLWYQAHGQTTAHIGSTLGVSPNTARTHLRRAYIRIGAEGRRQAYLWYTEHASCCIARALYDSALLGAWVRSLMGPDAP